MLPSGRTIERQDSLEPKVKTKVTIKKEKTLVEKVIEKLSKKKK